ncbi:MAG: DNA-binding protein [Bacteroidota bacterium]
MSNTVAIPKPIRSKEELDAAFARIDELMSAQPGTSEGEELDLLSELVWAYEQRHHTIDPPNPIALLNSKLESGELSLDQLKEVLPNRSTRSQVLNKKRRISMKAALELVDRGWVPVESFFQTSYWSSFEK